MDEDLIILDEDEIDDDLEDYRNARRRRRPGRWRRPRYPRPYPRPRPRPMPRPRPRPHHTKRRNPDWPAIFEAGAQALAAIQPLPDPPVAIGEAGIDLGNLVLYQQALAEHAKRDEQLRTIGSIAGKLLR